MTIRPLDAIADAARTWQDEGFVVVPGLVPAADVDSTVDELAGLYAGDTFDDYNRARGLGDGRPEGARFRETQFDGMRGFPAPACPHVNDLFVHPRVIEFARAALADDDIRLYQAAVWAKWAGAVNYEQPLHRDSNHSVLPPRMEPGFWHLETFLYLTDVDEGSAPPRLLPRRFADLPAGEREAHEVVAAGERGTLLAYRSDVWHRGTDFTRPDGQRTVLVAGYRPASADWFSYDAFGRHGDNPEFAAFVAGKTPDQLALVGIPRPGHPYWTPATLDAMAAQYPGLDLTPWRTA